MRLLPSTNQKGTTFSGFLATGPGTTHNPISFGSVEFGAMFHRPADGCQATGAPKALGIAGCQGSGPKNHNRNLATFLRHRVHLIRALQRSGQAKNIFTFQATGNLRTTVIVGGPDTGTRLLKTGSGFRRDTFGRLTVACISLAIGTTSFKIAVPVSLRFISQSQSIWPTTTATVHRTRLI